MKKLNFSTRLTSLKYKPSKLIAKLVTFSSMALVSANAFASSSGGSLPFVAKLSTLSDAISGPVALSVATVLVVATGLMNAFGEWGDGMKKLINIAFWTSTAFGVASLLSTFGSTGASF